MTFPTGTSLYASNPNTATIIGRIIVLSFSIKIENATSGGKEIINYLPADLRPSGNVPIQAETGLGDGKSQSILMKPDGALTFWPVNTGKTTYAIGSGVYVI